jgi:hypothetical protein
MPFSARTTACQTLLLGSFLLLPGLPAQAGGDRSRNISARDFVDGARNDPAQNSDLLFSQHSGRGHDRPRRIRGREHLGRLDEESASDRMRALAYLDALSALEDRLNDSHWLPFRHHDPSGPAVLESLDRPAADASSKDESLRSHFRIKLLRGVQYRQEFPVGDRKLSLEVYGPVVPGGPGLGLQMKSRVADHGVRMKAYGSMDEAGFTIDINF